MRIMKSLERSIRRRIKSRQLRKAGVASDGAAVLVTGGLGDLIVIARFMRDFVVHTGETQFSIFYSSPSLAEAVFRNVPGFTTAYPERLYGYGIGLFAYSLRINQFIYVDKWPDIRRFLSRKVENTKIFQLLDTYEKAVLPLSAVRDNHPFLDGALGRYAAIKGHQRKDFLHYLSGIKYGGDQLPIVADHDVLGKFGLIPGRYVTVHNGYDENMQGVKGARATKAYPYWGEVVSHLKAHFGDDIQFVQIGTPTTSETIEDVDHNLVGKTNLAQAIGLVAQAAFHLDNEGGFVHVASAFDKRSCVVFGPTSLDYFAYVDNLNFAPRECGDCWWSEKTWMTKCPRGDVQPACMTKHDPFVLAKAISDWWSLKSIHPQQRVSRIF